MKYILIFLFGVGCLGFVKAQNLVPNPSFEIINAPQDTVNGGCFLVTGGFNTGQVPPWDSPTLGSPDPFNTCSHPVSSASVPLSGWGYQQPNTGSGYGAEAFYALNGNADYREYMQVELDSELVAGQNYCASFYINHADSSKIACNNFGMYFSTIHTFSSNYFPLNNLPQINDTNIVSETLNWTLISGQFVAQGGERYILIGNFYSNLQTDTIQMRHPLLNQEHVAYYFIDDIDVHRCPMGEGVGELGADYGISIYPNPSNGTFKIKSEKNRIKNIIIFNLLGEKMYSEEIKETQTATLNLIVPPGVYFVEATTEKGKLRKKIIIQ